MPGYFPPDVFVARGRIRDAWVANLEFKFTRRGNGIEGASSRKQAECWNLERTHPDPTLSIFRRSEESWPQSTYAKEVDDGEAPSKGVPPRSICTKIYVAWLDPGSRPVDAKHGQVRCSHSRTEYGAVGGGCSAQSVGEDELNLRRGPP